MAHTTSGGDEPINVADHNQHKTRVLSRQCDTCIFRPGNPMMLEPGRLRGMVDDARSRQRFIVCHDTLPYGPHPAYGPAVCRGFYDRYDTQALQLARRLWGIVEVPPPAAAATEQHTPPATETAEDTRALPLPQAPTTRPVPLVLVDVDGVLNPDGSRQEALGYRPHHFDGIGADGQAASGIVWLHPDHGAWLAELEAAGGTPVWATSWDQLANTWIAPRLGLAGSWPVVDLQGRVGVRWGHALKLDPITAYAADAPFVLLDDQIGGKDHDWAAERTAGGAPTLLVAIDPYTGLTRADIDRVLDWLADPSTSQLA